MKDIDVEIEDLDPKKNNTLTIKMRVKALKAGYQLIFFAHACILLETVRLLNNNSLRLFYVQSLNRRILAGQ